MAVAYPLTSDGQIVRALCFIASTSAIDQDIPDTAKSLEWATGSYVDNLEKFFLSYGAQP
ncbi:hypothetical protein Desde_1849 [Desulfitobacterium dehalogenans ATCC 51507]|uniref:Uncharacterized protein n=1 Tax=Desulfitobacterium dehalogenans (strain ATCC 51507 / DSM 9161 / JW/IU-DC1) TaxID=756499 RepID=I4A8F8_DESDJ|nr:hypothetical protein Desde_1849 [Desulfitobacterium dehalogenans ATCC 51507]